MILHICDSRWGSKSYNGTNLCNAECGYSSLAMVLSGLKNDSSINTWTLYCSWWNWKCNYCA